MQLTAPEKTTPLAATKRTGRRRDADSMAVASFILGLPGLLVGNIFLGPTAIVLATIALWNGTKRQGRAWFGMALQMTSVCELQALCRSWSVATRCRRTSERASLRTEAMGRHPPSPARWILHANRPGTYLVTAPLLGRLADHFGR